MDYHKTVSLILALISFQTYHYFPAVGGVCTNGDMRFSGPNSDKYSGRLEVCVGQTWGTVCDEQWDITDAYIACKQSGVDFIEVEYYTGDMTIALFGNHEQDVPVFLSGMMCSGSETNLLLCPNSNQDAIANITGYFKTIEQEYRNPCPTDRDVGALCRVVHGSDIRAVGQILDSPLSLGDNVSVGCTVYAGESVVVQPSVSWMMPNGQAPKQQTDTYFAPQDGHVTRITQSTLYITSLNVSDAGRYQCLSTITVPPRERVSFIDLKIQLPKPDSIMVVITNEEKIVRSGETLQLQCLAQIAENSGTTVQFLWKKDGLTVISDASERRVITDGRNDTHIWSILTLSPFSTLPDNGLYACEGTASAWPASDHILPAMDMADIIVAGVGNPIDLTQEANADFPVVQIRFIGVGLCENWVITNTQQRLDQITTTIIDFLTTSCECTISLINSRFQCFQDQNAVMFRAQIWPIGTTGAEFFQEFINTQSPVVVDEQQLDIDSSCAANVSSFAAPECPNTSSSNSGMKDGGLLWVILMGIISGVLIVAIVIAIIIILALALRTSRKKKLQNFSRNESSLPVLTDAGPHRENGIHTETCVAYHPSSDIPVTMEMAHTQQEMGQQQPTQQQPCRHQPPPRQQRLLPAPPTTMQTHQQLVPFENRQSTASTTASYDYI